MEGCWDQLGWGHWVIPFLHTPFILLLKMSALSENEQGAILAGLEGKIVSECCFIFQTHHYQPKSYPSPALNLSQHQGFSNESG